MLEALKARNPVYRAMLAYFLWLGRQSVRFQWAFIIGIFVGSRIARSLSAAQPDLKWLWVPVLVLFYAFVYLSWTAQPMFNLLLRFNRFGRHVLSADQRAAANWFGATFGLALAAVAWWLATGSELGMFTAVALAVLSICVAATFNRTGRDRTILGSCTLALAMLAAGATWFTVEEYAAGATFMSFFAIGFIAFQLLANGLASRAR
jgi:hypothetical protein